MSIGRTNASGGHTGATLTVAAPAGVTVTVVKNGKTYTRTASVQGIAVFTGLETGTWAVTISDGDHNPTTRQVLITADYAVTMAFFAATIAVTYPAGSTCTCTKSGTVLTATGTSGSYTFTVSEIGSWTVSCTDGTNTASRSVDITADGQSMMVVLKFNTIPDFAYTGDFEVVDDNDNPITTSQDNWKIRLLTSGTLTFADLRGAADGIDVFLVGGGGKGSKAMYDSYSSSMMHGAGGGSGYTKTEKGIHVLANTDYQIDIGASDGNTTAFSVTANKGSEAAQNSVWAAGGNGGSGGGKFDGIGGTDGANAVKGGTGQGTTTREFGESTGTLYAQGGNGGANRFDIVANTGNGGCGAHSTKGGDILGASGIVIIRNKR